MTRTWRTLTGLAAVMALGATACTSSGEGAADRVEELPNFALAASLQSFDACDDLLSHLRTEGLERVGPYGLDGGDFFDGPIAFEVDVESADRHDSSEDSNTAAPTVPDSETAQGGPPVEGEDFSGTNVQEGGVDEPDIVKTDGERMFVLSPNLRGRGSDLHVLDVDGAFPERQGSITLDAGWNHEMFLAGDRIIVMGATDGVSAIGPTPVPLDDIGRDSPVRHEPLIVIQEIDVSDPAQPKVVSTLRTEGRYLSARAVGDVARVVVQFNPVNFDFVFPSGPRRGEETAETANRQVIADSTLDQWLPSYALDSEQGTSRGRLAECDQVHAPTEFAGFGSLTVLTIDLAAGLTPGDGVSVIANGETVYASTDNLYVATNRYVDAAAVTGQGTSTEAQPIPVEPDSTIGGPVPPFGQPEVDYTTQIHKFSIDADGPADYQASGSVPGHVLNQYSMSEHEGDLRIATTDGTPWSANEQSSSAVSILRQQDDELEIIGTVGDLGRGERIFAVRFMGDTGYVVTFRQTDPLYTLDLSDPTDPKAVGELKIEGYSAYLHPVGENLLLGVGQDATVEGLTLGTQVSLFDVSDPANPTRTHQYTIGGRDGTKGSSSEIEWDARAFLYWPATGLAMIPFEAWDWSPNVTSESEAMSNGAIGLRIDEQSGITEVGRVTHQRGTPPREPDYGQGEEWTEESEIDLMRWFQSRIRRSAVVDDSVFTISDFSVLASDLDSLDEIAFIDLG